MSGPRPAPPRSRPGRREEGGRLGPSRPRRALLHAPGRVSGAGPADRAGAGRVGVSAPGPPPTRPLGSGAASRGDPGSEPARGRGPRRDSCGRAGIFSLNPTVPCWLRNPRAFPLGPWRLGPQEKARKALGSASQGCRAPPAVFPLPPLEARGPVTAACPLAPAGTGAGSPLLQTARSHPRRCLREQRGAVRRGSPPPLRFLQTPSGCAALGRRLSLSEPHSRISKGAVVRPKITCKARGSLR